MRRSNTFSHQVAPFCQFQVWTEWPCAHFVTLLVKWIGLFAAIDCGSTLAIVRVYMSENLSNLEEIVRPLLLKEPGISWGTTSSTPAWVRNLVTSKDWPFPHAAAFNTIIPVFRA